MDTSRTNYSQIDRMSRYTRRIDQLLNKTKSKSKSPYRCPTPKINNEGPMISRIHTYIKYKHSFIVLHRIFLFKTKQLMSDFMIILKSPTKRQSNLRPTTKFVVVKQPSPPLSSNILILRIKNISNSALQEAFQSIKRLGAQNKAIKDKKNLENKQKHQIKIKNNKIFGGMIAHCLARMIKTRYINSLNSINRIVSFNKKSAFFLLKSLQRMIIFKQSEGWKQLVVNSQQVIIEKQKLKLLALRMTQKLKSNILKIGRRYSIAIIKRPKVQDLNYLQYLNLNILDKIISKAINSQIINAFYKISQISVKKQIQSSFNNKSIRSASPKSPRNRKFPRQCDKFRRLVQVIKTKQIKIYDEVFQTLFQNRLDTQQFYFGNQLLKKIFITKVFKRFKDNYKNSIRQEKKLKNFPKVLRLLSSKMSIAKCDAFWKIYSHYTPVAKQPEIRVHKCAHGISQVLHKIYKNRIVEGYIEMKRTSNEYSQIRIQPIEDTSSIFIYDDMASFLQERQGAFQHLKNNYDRLKQMVGIQGTSEITSSSFQSIRAIQQIKNRLLNRFQ